MLRKFSLATLAITVAALTVPQARAQTTFFDNLTGITSGFTSSVRPTNVLDVFTLSTSNVRITSFQFLFSVPTGGSTGFTSTVNFWNTVNPAATPVNSGSLGGFVLNFGAIAAGLYLSNAVDLSGLPGGGIVIPDNDFGIQIQFSDATPGNTADNITIGFTNNPVTTGTGSPDVFWRDADNNGQFDPSDARAFATPNLADFGLKIGGVAVVVAPEPGSFALVGVGLLPLVGLLRRRRA